MHALEELIILWIIVGSKIKLVVLLQLNSKGGFTDANAWARADNATRNLHTLPEMSSREMLHWGDHLALATLSKVNATAENSNTAVRAANDPW